MKKALSLILGTFCAVFPVSAEDLFHAGGLGTDIWNARLEAEKTSGKNYLSNGNFSQGSGDFSNSQDMKWGRIYSRKALGKAIPQDLLNVIRIDLNGKKAAHFINEEGLSAFQDAKGNPVLANVIAQYVKVEKGGNYILSFRASGFHSKKAGQHIAMTSVACFEGPHQKGKTKPTQYNFFTFSQSEKSYQVKVPVPEKTRNILISITLRGIGEMKISDLEFREAATTGEPKPILWTLGFLDNRFCIGENLPASMQFLFHWPKDVKAAAPRLNIRLPKGFRIAAPSIFLDDLRNEGNNVWSCAIHGRSINALTPLAALQLRSDLPASEKRYKAEFWITNSGKKYTVHSMELQVIPEFRGIQPKNFLYGTMNPWLDNYKGAAAVDQANLYRQTGFNIMSARGKDQYEACLKAGMTIQGTAPYHDGYEMGLSFKKPENVIFRRIDGTPQKAMSFRFQNYAICPTEVINRGEFYRNCVWKTIENRLNQIDLMGSIWFANWEPQYTKNGCWCERCREEFIKYTKLPAADVRKYWPREIQDKYEPQWVKFRKWQAGRMIVNLERDTRAIAKKHGKNVDFQIELCRDSMLESLCKDYYLYDPGEYLSEVKRMGAWGPYLFFDIRNPNDYNNAFYMRSFLTTKGVQAYIDKRLKPGATRPLISGLIHNTQGVHWLAPPSAFAFESYSYFLNKWAGVRGYFFPHGADHRYFSGAARASADFARTEDFVWKGKERKNITAVPVTPFPENQMKGALTVRFLILEIMH